MKHVENILDTPQNHSWTSRWLEVLKTETERGMKVEVPRYGFGDATSYGFIKDVVEATKDTGAVRHGAECFNYFFPQELDVEYLIVWDGFEGKDWDYVAEDELRVFLCDRAREGFSFPLNPVWLVRDHGWYEV